MNMDSSIIKYPFWIIVFLFLVLHSCEYESNNEYYKDIEKPGDILIGVDLGGVPPNEPIYIYENTKLYYSFNGAGKKLLSMEAFINGEFIQTYNESFLFIDKSLLKKDIDNILNIKVRLKTGSGSIADIMDAEYYEGNFSYILKAVDNNIKLTIREALNEDKYLKLEWDKLELPQLNVAGYEVSFTDTKGTQQKIILDKSATSFIDKSYVHGYRAYHITVKFAENKISDKTSIYNMSYSQMTSDDIFITFKDVEETKISWKENKYRCKYYILHDRNDEVVASASYQNPVAYLPAPAFPEETGYYTIIIVPDDTQDTEISYSSGGIEKFYQYRASVSPLDMAVITYDLSKNHLYGRTGTTVQIGDAASLKTIKSYNPEYFSSLTSVSVSPKSNKFLVYNGYNYGMSDNIIYIYNDKNNLNTTPVKVSSPQKQSRYGKVYLINDNRIFIQSSHYDSSISKIYNSFIDLDTGNIIYDLESDLYTSIDISYDRERLITYNEMNQKLKIYNINSDGLTLVNTINIPNTAKGYGVFNPYNSDIVIITSASVSNSFYIIDISSQKTQTLEGTFITVDPFTGRIYCYNKDYNTNSLVDVYEKNNFNAPVFQFKANKYGDMNVYNDFVVSYGSYFQISKHIK